MRLRDSWQFLLGIYMVATFLEAALFGQLNGLVPLHLTRLDVAAADVPDRLGQMYALAGLVGIPFLPFWGALADRYSRRPVIVRSFLAHAVAGTVMALAPSAWVFTAGFAVTALAFGNTGLMTATLAERTPAGRSGFAITTMNSAAPVGAFVGPIVGGPVFDAYGLPTLLWANVAVMLLVFALLTFGYSDPYRGHAGRPLVSMAIDGVALLVRSPRIRSLFTALFILIVGWLTPFAFLPLAVSALYSGPLVGTTVGIVSGAAGLAVLAFGPVIGALADRWGHWQVLCVATAIAAVLFPLGALAPDIVMFGAFWAIVTGIRGSAFGLSFSVMASSAAPEHRGRVMSFAFLPVNVGFAVGPLLASPLARANVFLVFPFAGAVTALGLLALLWSRRQPVLPAAAVPAT